MRIIADTNILVRAITEDDLVQSKAAQAILSEAEFVALPLSALCELAWVLGRAYRFGREDIARAISGLASADNVGIDEAAVDAGLTLLAAGGDFADGVIGHTGRWMGGDVFMSFDRKAVELMRAGGHVAAEPI